MKRILEPNVLAEKQQGELMDPLKTPSLSSLLEGKIHAKIVHVTLMKEKREALRNGHLARIWVSVHSAQVAQVSI
jgi:hypothetical protein